MKAAPVNRLDHFTSAIPMVQGDGEAVRSHQIAGAGSRFLAGFVDLILQLTAFALMTWVALTGRPDLFPRESWVWAGPLAFVEWHIIYMMLFESFTRGQTPGKAMVGLRVVTLTGDLPKSFAFVLRNVARLVDLLLGGYIGSLLVLSRSSTRQRLGDVAAGTLVVYRMPIAAQMKRCLVPESVYSTSEDGYLLEAWVEREHLMDEESRHSSAIDLAAYLQSKYGSAGEEETDAEDTDAIEYLRGLYAAEHAAAKSGISSES